MATFFMTEPSIDSRIPRAAIISVDAWPTLHYYGTCELRCEVSDVDAERYGLVPCDRDARDAESDAGGLYRAETAYAA